MIPTQALLAPKDRPPNKRMQQSSRSSWYEGPGKSHRQSCVKALVWLAADPRGVRQLIA